MSPSSVCRSDSSGRFTSRSAVEERGTTAIEYALIAAAIAVVIALVVYGIGFLTRSNVAAACENWTDAASGVSAIVPDC